MPDPTLLGSLSVLDTSGASGALAGRLVAELGATVIRPEPPTGDPLRQTGPRTAADRGQDGSLVFAALNSGKRSVILDPADAAGLAALVATVDVVLHSRPSPYDLDVEAAVAAGRSVVEVRGFSPDGPYADWQAPDIVTSALGGLLYISGDPALPPCPPPEPLGEYFASVWAALALVSAGWTQRTRGLAAVYRISTQEALATQEHLIRAAAMDGEPIVRNGSQHKSVAPANVYPTKDGFVYIYVSRNHWPAFLGAWDGHPEEYDDPRWTPNSVRRAGADRLNQAVTAWTRTFDSADLVARLQGAGVPCLPVNRPSDFQADAQVQARELFAPVDHPTLGRFRQVRFPALIDGQRPPASRPPQLGEHDGVLAR